MTAFVEVCHCQLLNGKSDQKGGEELLQLQVVPELRDKWKIEALDGQLVGIT